VPTEYDHPLLEPILKETYGIMIYQEQVMQAAQILAGYTLGGADVLRRAMGKKKPEEMAKQRAIFVEGCAKKNNIRREGQPALRRPRQIRRLRIQQGPRACYGVITCQTAWLKARYPVQFMAALLSNELDNTDKIALFVAEAKAMGLAVLPPSVNESGSVFTVKDKSIRFGLSAIKNVGEAAVELIIAAREKEGPFRDLHDLCSRVESRAMNKKLARKPGQIGRLRRLRPEPRRAADADRRRARAGQRPGPRPRRRPGFPARSARPDGTGREKIGASARRNGVPDWPLRERLGYEKELLGFYITGHPLDDYADRSRRLPAPHRRATQGNFRRDRHAPLRPRHQGRNPHHPRTKNRGPASLSRI
jgi:DNA polymerase-3 subunit alpha